MTLVVNIDSCLMSQTVCPSSLVLSALASSVQVFSWESFSALAEDARN